MKQIKHFSLLVSLAFFTLFAFGQSYCDTQISYTNPNATFLQTGPFVFEALPTVGNGQYNSYVWDFGDGSTAYGDIVTYDYPYDGTYNVCLTVIDSLTGCVFTTCESVVVFGAANNNNSCDASFIVTQVPGSTLYAFVGAMSNLLIPNLTFSWDMGDGGTSTDPAVSYSYANNGVYNVCLTVEITGTCTDTYCDSIAVNSGYYYPPDTSCLVDIQYLQNAIGQYDFTAIPSSGYNTVVSEIYDWNINGISMATGATMSTFLTPNAINVVCVNYIATYADGSLCTATNCETINTGYYYYPPDSTCDVSYTYSSSGAGYTTFFANSAVSPNSVAYIIYNWSVDGALLNNGSSFIDLNLPANSTSLVCVENIVTFFDGTTCTSTYCDTVTTGNNGGGNPDCTAFFFMIGIDSLEFEFLALSQADTYDWDFGDGTTGTGYSVSHTYAAVDTYEVCLYTTATDPATGNVCADTFCVVLDYMNVFGPPPPPPPSLDSCNAMFFSGYSGFLGLTFQAMQPNFSGTASYSWDFGDGNTGNGEVVNHNYANSGTYNVCLTVSDTLLNCSETVCQLITYSNYPVGNGIDISGNVNLAGDDFAIVYLVEFDGTDSSLNVIDATISSYLQGGDYTFNDVDDGTYLIKAALIPGSEFYWDYLPTYYGDVELWSNASDVIVSGSNVFNVDINLIAGINTGGPGFIGGLIADGAGKVMAIPMPEVEVILYNELNQPIAYTYTDLDGNYSFDNLAYGTYFVTVDVPGMDFIFFEVEITANETIVTGVNLTSGDEILGIENQYFNHQVTLSPNPNMGAFNITIEEELILNNAFINVYSFNGKLLYRSELVNNTNYISTKLTSGIYKYVITENNIIYATNNFVVK